MTEQPLFVFKAGRVEYDAKTGQATPLKGQGQVVFKRSSEDALFLAIQWQPRASYMSLEPGEELMVLPSDVEFTHIPQCETGRVISMQYLSSGERTLFWLQDAGDEDDLGCLTSKDKAILAKLNELANYDIDESMED